MPDLFSDRRKAFTAIGCLLIALATLGTIIYYIMYTVGQRAADDDPGPSASEPVEETEGIGLEEAREIALADAGLDASQASFYQETLLAADGPQAQLYQFKFKSWNVRYEYQINAQTGAVYSKVKEITATPAPSLAPEPAPTPEPTSTPASSAAPKPTPAPDSAPPVQNTPAPDPTPSPTPSQPAASLYIGMDRAKSIALEHAELSASQVRFTHAEMDQEDRRMVYELEFYWGSVEYEYEIDAETGRILSFERDTDSAPPAPSPTPAPSQPSTSMYIGMDRAKTIALEHAELSASQVRFTHVGMDREDGRMVYEIEFQKGRVEYEYEIDAETGRILSHERDTD